MRFLRNLQVAFLLETKNQEPLISSPEDLNQYSKLLPFQITFETQISRTIATVDFLLTKFVYDEFFYLKLISKLLKAVLSLWELI